MEELKKELEKLSKAYVDTPENEEKILIPFIKRLLELPMKDRRKLLPLIRELQWINFHLTNQKERYNLRIIKAKQTATTEPVPILSA